MQKIPAIPHYTRIGLFIAFFGATIVILAFDYIAPDPLTNAFVIERELSIFILAGFLILLITNGEELELDSIGLHGRHWGKSILWSLLLFFIFFAVILGCLGLFKLVGISFGQAGSKYDKISLVVLTLMMLRAGVVEEIFYRGYIMERVSKIYNHWVAYLLIPSFIFGLLHFRQGIGGIIIAFVGGLVIGLFYWKTRDLKATIMAHFMVDYTPNVLVPLITGETGNS